LEITNPSGYKKVLGRGRFQLKRILILGEGSHGEVYKEMIWLSRDSVEKASNYVISDIIR